MTPKEVREGLYSEFTGRYIREALPISFSANPEEINYPAKAEEEYVSYIKLYVTYCGEKSIEEIEDRFIWLLYGGVRRSLKDIKTLLHIGDRERAEKILDNLIKEMGE